MNGYLALSIGLLLAAGGGELFIRGLIGLARWLRVPAGIIGATLAAFATSSPELAVSSIAAAEGHPQLGLGNALGANVVNLAVIFAGALLVASVTVPADVRRRDYPAAALAPALTGLLVLDGALSRWDGAILLGVFLLWLALTLSEARRHRDATATILGTRGHGRAIAFAIAGFAALILAGHVIVSGAQGVARSLGMDDFILGAVVVALGTTTPELAAALIAALRGHQEVALGTVLGSNIFNGLFIVAVAALVHPIGIVEPEVVIGLGFGLLATVFAMPYRGAVVGRRRGLPLIAIYLAYLAAMLQIVPA